MGFWTIGPDLQAFPACDFSDVLDTECRVSAEVFHNNDFGGPYVCVEAVELSELSKPITLNDAEEYVRPVLDEIENERWGTGEISVFLDDIVADEDAKNDW